MRNYMRICMYLCVNMYFDRIYSSCCVKMRDFQYRSYLTVNNDEGSFKNADILDMPQHFFMGLRSISNIAFPNKRFGYEGYVSFKNKYLKGKLLRDCSEKFYKIIKY